MAFGQQLDDELIVYLGPGRAVRLAGSEAATWAAAAQGSPVDDAIASALEARRLLRPLRIEREEDAAAAGLPEGGRVPSTVRWRREGLGAVYVLDSASGRELGAHWLTEPHATFFEAVARGGGVRRADRVTRARYGAAWSPSDSLRFLAALQCAGLVADLPAALGSSPQRLELDDPGSFWDIEAVSDSLRYATVPWYLLWELTYLCNLRCKTCYATEMYSGPLRQLPRIPADLRKVLDEILRAEIFHVTLIGGEPTTSPALYPVCEELKRNHVYVKIVSNGTLIDRRMAETLAELGVNEVNVSVDGFTASENDPIRGAGTFERIRKGVRALLDAGLPRVALSVTAGSHNLGSLEGLPEICRRVFGVSEVFLTRMICSGEGRQTPGSRLSPEDNSALRRWIDEEWAQRCPEVRVWTQRWHCDCARTRCVINPKGEMRSCTFHGKNVANIDGGLLAAWTTAGDFDKVRRPYRYTEVCRDCEAQLTCKGTACSARVFAADNRMISKECILSPGVVARYGE